ncbi:unnamed protein product, partial [Polarella glacialis]
LIQRPFPAAGKLRRLVAAAVGMFDGIEGLSRGGSSSSIAAVTPGVAPSAALAADAAAQSSWNCESTAKGLIENASQWQVERSLASLSAERLRELCTTLRARAVE